jgi:hypothetical protein
MHCYRCLSKAARFRELRKRDWLIAPLGVPMRCDRCISSYYYPTLLLPIRLLLDKLEARRKRRSEQRRTARKSTSADARAS